MFISIVFVFSKFFKIWCFDIMSNNLFQIVDLNLPSLHFSN